MIEKKSKNSWFDNYQNENQVKLMSAYVEAPPAQRIDQCPNYAMLQRYHELSARKIAKL